MHIFRFDVKYKPGEEVFHIGIQKLVTVKAILIRYEDSAVIEYELKEETGRKVMAYEEMLVPVEHARFYLDLESAIKPFDKGRY